MISAENKGFHTIEQIAKEKNSPVLTPQNSVELCFENGKNYAVVHNKKYAFNLLGLWQKENLELALGAIDYLKNAKYGHCFDIPDSAVQKGLETVNWICRMQYIPKYNILIDGTHNPDGARVLRQSLDYYFPYKKRVWVYGSLTTKDYKTVMQTLFNRQDEVYFYDFDYPNAVSFKELQNNTDAICSPIGLRELEYLSQENKQALIIISGSFYMIGQILKKSNFLQNIAESVNIY